MRALITGGAGFIGSHLADAMVASGHEVILLDDLSTGRRENVAGIEDRPEVRFVEGSVLDERIVGDLVGQSDVVIHLAAAVGVQLIVQRPLHSLTTNIRGSENVLAAAAKHGRKTLLASTSEIYGKNTAVPLSEGSDRVLGSPRVSRWAYSTSKAVDEILALAYHKEHGLPSVVVRLFNTVGPRQSAAYGMVIPRFAQQAVRGSPLTVYGTGNQTRTFCHVTDVVRAIMGLLLEPSAEGDVFNVGGTEEISIVDLAGRVIRAASASSSIRFIDYEDAYEKGFEDMQRRVPDTTKIRSLIGWEPSLSLDEIITQVVAEARSAMGAAATS